MVRTIALVKLSFATLLLFCALLLLSIPAAVEAHRPDSFWEPSPPRHSRQGRARVQRVQIDRVTGPRHAFAAPVSSPEVESPEVEAAAKKSKGFFARLFT
ncbi:uncharacterized protein UTRI_00524_B [Ustilago trichophora]|uniref:Uncharacterized protein n=1 Tax=Ustilago trichophora TaxID=86804 RepID=A0A5C3DPL7_9BASI|nr:uncharacterized protein UTRI_00524_B [Ustilago trichophora]